MERQKANCPGVREDRYFFSLVISQDVPELARASAKKVAVAFAFGDDMMDVSIDERVIIFRKRFLLFVKRQAFQHADVPFTKSRSFYDRHTDQF